MSEAEDRVVRALRQLTKVRVQVDLQPWWENQKTGDDQEEPPITL